MYSTYRIGTKVSAIRYICFRLPVKSFKSSTQDYVGYESVRGV
jgi:hypothetical protein